MRILVLGIIVHRGKVLIVRRAKTAPDVPNLGWALPGGRVEAGVSLEQALFREIMAARWPISQATSRSE